MIKNTDPLVSIITPSLNCGNYIEETINSVLNQSYSNIEYIIVDGLSTDNTKNIAEKYSVKFITQSREGWGGAVKEAIELSSKEYITYMDGDGSYNPKALYEMMDRVRTMRTGMTEQPDQVPKGMMLPA